MSTTMIAAKDEAGELAGVSDQESSSSTGRRHCWTAMILVGGGCGGRDKLPAFIGLANHTADHVS